MSQRLLAIPVALVVGLLVASATSQARQSSARGQERISRDWKQVSSGDLTAVGDASENELRLALSALEDFRFALLQFFPKFRLTSEVPTKLVVFKNNESFHRFKPRDHRGRREEFVGGYFSAQPDVNYMVLGAWANREMTFHILFHEYTHYAVHRNLSGAPAWLNEGLAEFYATFKSDYKDGRGLVGRPSSMRLSVLRSEPLIKLTEMMSNEGASKILRANRRIDMFYAQAWALVHYLHMARWAKGSADLTTYLRALESGGSVEEAVRTAFGSSVKELENELSQYIRKFKFPGIVLPVRPGGTNTDTVGSRMLERDARYLQGDLLSRLGVEDEAERELSKTLAEDPSHLPAQVAMARVRMQQDRRDEAITMLTAATATDQSDFAAHYFLGSALAEAERYTDAIGMYDRAVKLKPRSAAAWYGLSSATLALGRNSQSDAALAQVLASDSNPDWFQQHAYDAYRFARYESVVRDVRRFVDRQGWGDESSPYVAFVAALAHWRLKQSDEADAILAEAAPVIKSGSWPEQVLQFLQGKVKPDAFISRAKDNDERTEAYAYAGIKADLEGRIDEARKYLQWVKERGSRHYVEYEMAIADLRRLAAEVTKIEVRR